MQDSLTRQADGAAISGATTLTIKSPARALIPGEAVTIAGQSTVYDVTASTDTVITISPGLTSGVSDGAVITRQDRYALVSFDDVKDEFSVDSKEPTTKETVDLYKLSLRARRMLEDRCDTVFKSRPVTEVLSNDNSRLYNLVLRYRPVVSVASVTIQYVGEDSGTVIDADEYSVNTEQGTIYRPAGWPIGTNHITVVYTAGWSTVRVDHQQAFLQYLAILRGWSKTGDDALVGSNSKNSQRNFRDPEDLEKFMRSNFPRPRIRV